VQENRGILTAVQWQKLRWIWTQFEKWIVVRHHRREDAGSGREREAGDIAGGRRDKPAIRQNT